MFRSKFLSVLRELEVDEWLEWLKNLPPSIIDFTGGEPTLYHDFAELINGLVLYGHKWAITSNTLIIPEVSSNGCLSWTASYHPLTQIPRYHTTFTENILHLRDSGFYVSVSIVAYPSYLHRLEDMIAKFRAMEFPVGILPYYTTGFSWYETSYADEIQKFIPYMTENKNLTWQENSEPKLCSAGKDYVTVQPDGQVWRCYSGFIQLAKSHYMGNIKGRINPVEERCSIPCLFPCDWLRCSHVPVG